MVYLPLYTLTDLLTHNYLWHGQEVGNSCSPPNPPPPPASDDGYPTRELGAVRITGLEKMKQQKPEQGMTITLLHHLPHLWYFLPLVEGLVRVLVPSKARNRPASSLKLIKYAHMQQRPLYRACTVAVYLLGATKIRVYYLLFDG